MIGLTVGDASIGGGSAVGSVTFIEVQQASLLSIHVSWSYSGYDGDDNIYFIVYVDGRAVQRLPGSSRSTDLIVNSLSTHEVNVIPWRKDMPIEEDMYGSVYALRGHLEWDRPTDTGIYGYNIYSSDTELGTYVLYAEHDTVKLETGVSTFSAGDSTLTVSGNYNIANGHRNTLFTVTLVDDENLQISNDLDATVIDSPYTVGVPLAPMAGIVLTINGSSPRSGTATFLIGVQPYYDTEPLEDGTTWFKVSVVDEAGNESALSSPIAVSVNARPNPAEVTLEPTVSLGTLKPGLVITQSSSVDATDIDIYSNYDTSSHVFLDDVIMDVPLSSFALATSTETTYIFTPGIGASPDLSGEAKFVVRAVDSSGVDDGSSVVHSINYPVTADLPTPYNFTATPIEAGGVELRWETSEILPLGSFWRINGDIANYDSADTDPSEAGDSFVYVATLTSAEVGVEGTYTVNVFGVDISGFAGPSTSVTFTTDNTAPSGVTNITGVPF